MPSIQCIVVTPEKTALETTADFLALPMADGEMGVGENHAPMIGRLGFGEMRIVNSGQAQQLYIDGGFVQIANNEVTILTGKAVPFEDVDLEQAETQLREANRSVASTPEAAAIKTRNVEQARAQIRVAKQAGK